MITLTTHVLHRHAIDGAASDSVTLDYEGRFLRRRRVTTDSGRSLFIDLPETVSLNAGDTFETTDGTFVTVAAASEPLIEVTADGADLARLAWHVGNRHTPAQIGAGRILIREDRIIGDMLTRLGARVRDVTEPFTPEGGAYGHGRTHGHHHGAATDDPHTGAHADHIHDHSHSPDRRQAAT